MKIKENKIIKIRNERRGITADSLYVMNMGIFSMGICGITGHRDFVPDAPKIWKPEVRKGRHSLLNR